jgi:hypothetical protein
MISVTGFRTPADAGPDVQSKYIAAKARLRNAISLSGTAQVALTALAEDIVNKSGDTMSGAPG